MEKIKKPNIKSAGLKLAASYGVAPNRLGFCGPQCGETKKLARYLEEKISNREAEKILSKFEAAYAYLELIAKKNKIKNPFDKKVAEAFWVGNELLNKINAKDLKEMVLEKFTKPNLLSKNEAKERIKYIPKNSKPHHSFHVYVFGTITGRVSLEEAKMKDICRIGWGKVKKIQKSKITVEYYPIVKNKKFYFGKLTEKEIQWDKKIVSKIKIGDQVSFHWNILCQKLTSRQVKNLEKYTQNTLKSL